MKKTFLIGFMLISISACEATRGGAGQLTNGDPIVGELWQDNNLNQGFTISSVSGWQCKGQLTKEQRNDAVSSIFPVPVTCSNGWTGSSLVSLDRAKGSANINFKLSNGATGSVEIG